MRNLLAISPLSSCAFPSVHRSTRGSPRRPPPRRVQGRSGVAAGDAQPLDHGRGHRRLRRRQAARLGDPPSRDADRGRALRGAVEGRDSSNAGRGAAAAAAAQKSRCRSAPAARRRRRCSNSTSRASWSRAGDRAPIDDMTDWPREPHGIFVDHNDFVWVGSFNRHRVMKFTRDGKHLMTIGEYEKTGGSADTHLLGGPSGIWVDPQDQRGLHLRRLSQPPRDRVRRRDRQVPAPLGRLRQRAGRHRAVRSEDDGERRAAEAVLDAARHHRIEGRQDLRRRPPRQPDPGVRSPGQVPRRESDRAGDAVVGLRVRAGAVARSRSSSGSTSRTAPTTRSGFCGGRISRSSASSAAADASSDRCCARTA